jgi:protein CpxP
MGGPHAFPGSLPMIAVRLDLTDAQREQMRAVLESHRDEMKVLDDRSRAAHQALGAIVVSEVVDEATIRARSADVADVDADTAVGRARIHAEIWQILTPDQQAQAKRLQSDIARRQERGRERSGQQRDGPDPRRPR